MCGCLCLCMCVCVSVCLCVCVCMCLQDLLLEFKGEDIKRHIRTYKKSASVGCFKKYVSRSANSNVEEFE
jgi:hypothetical protein